MDATERPRNEILETALLIINARFAKGTLISKPEDAHDFMKLELVHIEHELFAVMWLDNRHRVIAFETLFRELLTVQVFIRVKWLRSPT